MNRNIGESSTKKRPKEPESEVSKKFPFNSRPQPKKLKEFKIPKPWTSYPIETSRLEVTNGEVGVL